MILKIQELQAASFAKYGTFLNPLALISERDGKTNEPVLFYPDQMLQTFATTNLVAFCPLIIQPREFVITDAEKHNYTEEVIGGFTEDVCFHVMPAGDEPDTDKMEVFRLPRGWWVRFKRGIWHKAPFVLGDKPTYGIVCLPPHTYTNDCDVVEFDESFQIATEE